MLTIFNTLTRRKEAFKPLKKGRVGLYTCGPTVYNYAHIGNLRAYVFEDTLKRVLLFNKYKVKHVMNITDVDDKTIRASREANQTLKNFTAVYTRAFKEDTKKLNILSPGKYAPATDYIKPMVALTQKLLKNGFAYQKDGSVYFNIKKFKNYGKLARLNFSGLKVGARVDVDNYEKENPADFALWKAWTPKDGSVFWQTPLGKGRPGWHIECSAISAKELGQPFDIHAGGVDLIFPHHENEIAQSEAALNKPFVKYWLHGEHLLVDNQKMAKSLNNFFTLRDLTTKSFNPLAFRYLLLTTHYRSKLNFTLEALEATEKGLEHLYAEACGIKDREIKKKIDRDREIKKIRDKFLEKVNDDLDTPGALALVWNAIKNNQIDYKTLLEFDRVLGLGLDKVKKESIKVPSAVQKLLDARAIARAKKNWKESDRLRQEIRRMGFSVQDGSVSGGEVIDGEEGQEVKKGD